jgi:hypothetical protein
VLLNWSFDRGRQEVSFRLLDHCHKLFWTANLDIADYTSKWMKTEWNHRSVTTCSVRICPLSAHNPEVIALVIVNVPHPQYSAQRSLRVRLPPSNYLGLGVFSNHLQPSDLTGFEFDGEDIKSLKN